MSRSSHSHSRRRLRVLPGGRSVARTLFVIPARDEEASIGALLDQLVPRVGPHVLVISDASTDDTATVARRHGARVLELPLQLGAWGATQAGLRFARRQGYRQVITLDADGQHEPLCIPDLQRAHRELGADIVIGTFPNRLSPARKLAWRWFRMLSGLRVEDLTSGFRCYGSEAIDILSSSEATLLDYQDVGVLLLARRHGLRVAETPVKMYPRRAGHSRVFASWITVGYYMVQTTLLCIARVGRFGGRPLRHYEARI
ncbi:glycosyltransferase family 2 protein [Pseudomarimonas salicorniae]|uniref:Glycosyltransferase family 2 protein n=1 Tax=Pseudomarimonas salicorniae TaxID=2933270 RepID=A0ABT0GH16_9GAMM|nr:glycosyltransferase family 2 protein [Lysobacter sp. CAU 1642]MCK7593827.1 glycosyltransferase family 2 protein [Lysobacter sp. CAU 1642]